MAPKKKGKGSKLARMSDEERARYLQHRAAIEEEARRRKEQLIATFMKNKLKKEEAFSRLNVAKINQQWRHTLRGLKCAELKQDLEALYLWFDHAANKKTKLIENLLDDLQSAEGQYARIHQCHMESVDTLLGIYDQRISRLQEMFEEERDQMLEKARSYVDAIVNAAISSKEHLLAIIFRTQQTSDEEAKHITLLHQGRVEELRNSMLTELERLVNNREARMDSVWNDIQSAIRNHWIQTEDRRREYLNLRDADAENYQQIFHYHQQICSLNDVLQSLRKQLTTAGSAIDERVIERTADKASSTELFHVLRRKLVVEKEADHKKLCSMTDVAENTTKDLTKALIKGEQILQLLSHCRKFETLEEKVCPGGFDKGYLTESIEASIQNELTSFQEQLAEQEFKKYTKMGGFWRRFNRVFLEKETISLHYKTLANEHRQLKSILKQYLTQFASNPPPPKAPLMAHRSVTTNPTTRRSISLIGEKVAPRSGKRTSCSDSCHTPSFIHMLTIELTKP